MGFAMVLMYLERQRASKSSENSKVLEMVENSLETLWVEKWSGNH